LTSHVSARLGSRQENSAASLPERIFQDAENRLPGELNCLPRSITAGWRSTIDGCSTFWRISGDQHKRRRPNVIFGNGLRKLRFAPRFGQNGVKAEHPSIRRGSRGKRGRRREQRPSRDQQSGLPRKILLGSAVSVREILVMAVISIRNK
jgi:hypothetical protein